MRSDYLLYLLAAVFFIITAVSLALIVDQTEKNLWVVTTVVLGLFSIGLGYYQRPKVKPATTPISEMQTAEPSDAHVREAHIAESVETHIEPTATPISTSPVPMQEAAPIPVLAPPAAEVPAPMESGLMAIKGIGAKRALQLKELGINSVDDLASASAEDLAKNLMISPKITRMWIGSAKKIKK